MRRELLLDLVGLAGFGLLLSGVCMLWGLGWTLIVAGGPLAVIYVARELGLARRLPRRS